MQKLIYLTFVLFSHLSLAEEMPTRYGKLSTNEDANILYYAGKPVVPEIAATSSFTFLNKFNIVNTDVVLLQNNGGSGCAAYYSFLTISLSGLSQSVEFGTCSDLPKIRQEKNLINIELPNVNGKGIIKYIYSAGEVFQNGKKLTAQIQKQ